MTEQKTTGTRKGRTSASTKTKEVTTSKKASAPALPSGVEATFKARPKKIEFAYIKREGEQEWFFNETLAQKHFPGNYKKVRNPYFKG